MTPFERFGVIYLLWRIFLEVSPSLNGLPGWMKGGSGLLVGGIYALFGGERK